MASTDSRWSIQQLISSAAFLACGWILTIAFFALFGLPLSSNPLLRAALAAVTAIILSSSIVNIYYYWRARSAQPTSLTIGKQAARLVSGNKKITFKDFGGARPDALKHVVEFLTEPQKFTKLGGRMSNGILVVGRSGSGKTLLAQAVAGEANCPCFHLSAMELCDTDPGAGATKIEDMFRQGRLNAPCALVIDDIDAIAKRRTDSPDPLALEQEFTLNALLSAMDKLEANNGVIVFGTTNRPDLLDEALLRAGRFDTIVEVPQLTGDQLPSLFRLHTKAIPLDVDVDLDKISARLHARMPDANGADVRYIIDLAATRAASDNAATVRLASFLAAVEQHADSRKMVGHTQA